MWYDPCIPVDIWQKLLAFTIIQNGSQVAWQPYQHNKNLVLSLWVERTDKYLVQIWRLYDNIYLMLGAKWILCCFTVLFWQPSWILVAILDFHDAYYHFFFSFVWTLIMPNFRAVSPFAIFCHILTVIYSTIRPITQSRNFYPQRKIFAERIIIISKGTGRSSIRTP